MTNSTPPNYLLLFADVFLVEGAGGTLLISYGRKQMFEISPGVAYVTRQLAEYPIEELKAEFSVIGDKLTQYFDFLIRNQLAFYTDNPALYPPISRKYERPAIIDNCIVEMGPQMSLDAFREVLVELALLGTDFLELRFYEPRPLAEIRNYLQLLEKTTITGVDLIMAYRSPLTDRALYQLTLDFQRLAAVYVHSAPEDRHLTDQEFKLHNEMGQVFYLTQQIDGNSCCGMISKASLSIGTLETILHNMGANSCLNKKIAIDLQGNIKNCPSLPEVYGNIANDRLHIVAQNKTLQKYWRMTKDQIEVCKDCKYRYICTDCRAFVADPEKENSKPLKCSYDPYKDVWEANAQPSVGVAAYQVKDTSEIKI